MSKHSPRLRVKSIREQTNLRRTFIPISLGNTVDLASSCSCPPCYRRDPEKVSGRSVKPEPGESCVRRCAVHQKLSDTCTFRPDWPSEMVECFLCVSLVVPEQHSITSNWWGEGGCRGVEGSKHACPVLVFVYCSRNVIKPERITIGGSTALPVQLHFDGRRMHF